MAGLAFKGVSTEGDARFANKEKKLLRTMKFPKEFEQKADLKRVKWEVMKAWIATRVTELLGIEDEVLIGYIYEQLEGKSTIDPRILQINLTGFLEKNTSLFVKELWSLLVSASQTESGIPQKMLDEKAEELRKKKEIQDQINERLARDREAREKERREAREKEEAERAERQRQREKERRELREKERRERAAYEKEREERDRERREKDRQRREADRAREREADARRQKEREARREAERQRDAEKPRDRERQERPRDREQERERPRERSRERAPERREAHRREAAEPGRDEGPSAASPPPELPTDGEKRSRETASEGEPAAKKAKKEAKKESKKERKEAKKARKESKRKRREGSSGSEGPQGGNGNGNSLERRRSLEDELRQKALQSVQKPA